MRKLLLLPLVLLMAVVSLNAQSGLGIKAGLNFNSMSDIKYKQFKWDAFDNKTGFHVGILYKIDLPAGLALQPELLYSQKGFSFDTQGLDIEELDWDGDFTSHNLLLPINLQWGLDLMLLRPFIMVSPYLNYMISREVDIAYGATYKWDSNKFGYGIGIGAGIDIWKLQISGKYNWDLGKVSEFELPEWKDLKGGKSRYFELSLAFIF